MKMEIKVEDGVVFCFQKFIAVVIGITKTCERPRLWERDGDGGFT